MKKITKRLKVKNTKRKNWETDKNVRIILISLIVISIGILFGTVGYCIYKYNAHSKYQSRIVSVNYINTSVQIIPYGIGINADTDSLKFGKTFPGGGGSRHLILNSTKEALVKVTITGDMARFLTVDKNNFIIKPNVSDQVLFILEIPDDTPQGNYTGLIQVLFLKP
jgi:hypothetical protein